MKIIVGLGNPGVKYKETRHNFGFKTVDGFLNYLASQGENFTKFKFAPRFLAEISEGNIEKEKVFLVKPQTYMNKSGSSLAKFVKFFKIKPEKDLLIIYDDIDLRLGEIKTRGESSGGHKGMQSIILAMKTKKIPRLRLGILNLPKEKIDDTAKYVLSKFTSREKKQVNETIRKTFPLIEKFIKG